MMMYPEADPVQTPAKILVLGALGNVGAEVINQLYAVGVVARAGDLDPERLHERFGAAIEPVHFDFYRPESFAPVFAGIESVFLIRPPQISDVRKYLFPAIEAAEAGGVRRVVFLSIIDVEQNRRVPHYKVEQNLIASGMSYTFLRCSFFMQNLNTAHCADIRDRDEIYIPVGSARTSFIDVRDIGAVAATVLLQAGHENKAYDLTGAEALDYFQVAEGFSLVLGRRITYRKPSAVQYFARQLRQGAGLQYTLVTTWLYKNTGKGMADRVTDEVRNLTGREPIRLRQYIQDYQDYWRSPAKPIPVQPAV